MGRTVSRMPITQRPHELKVLIVIAGLAVAGNFGTDVNACRIESLLGGEVHEIFEGDSLNSLVDLRPGGAAPTRGYPLDDHVTCRRGS